MTSKKSPKFGMGLENDAQLMANLAHSKPLEMKQKNVSGMNKLFPFWKPVSPDQPEVHYDVHEMLELRSEWNSNARKFGNMTPLEKMDALKKEASEKAPTRIWHDATTMGSINNWLEKVNANKAPDLVGVVEPKMSDDLKATATTKIINGTNNVGPVIVDKSAKSRTGVGAVKPQMADNLKATATKTQITNVDWTKEQPLIVEKSAKSRTGVGAVKPEMADNLKATATKKQITNVDWTKDQPLIVEKSAKSRTGVGAVKPEMASDLKGTSTDKMITSTSGANPTSKMTAKKAK